MVDDFVERKHGRKEMAYPHPDLEPVLKDTYGVFLYQEQVMQTANVLAGFTMAQADALRKAMGKKIAEVMEKMGKLFVKGAIERGIDGALAQSIFDLMAGLPNTVSTSRIRLLMPSLLSEPLISRHTTR